MKIGLVLPGNICFSPYLKIYTALLDEKNIVYDIISWNRNGIDKEIGIQYKPQSFVKNRFSKILLYISYRRFIVQNILKNRYDKLIIFGPSIAVLIFTFLKRMYNRNFIFDYRDVSIEQKYIFRKRMKTILKYSFANFISSPGFINCLPRDREYLISHNFDIDKVNKALSDIDDSCPEAKKQIVILTIGIIRDYESNIEIVKNLANKNNILMQFIGAGECNLQIKDYCHKNKIYNVDFLGYYPKEDESKYIQESSFINIYLPRKLTHDATLSNRFYNALIYKKPMIVTKNTVHGDFIDKYKVGLSIENCDNLYERIVDYKYNFNKVIFNKHCNDLLKIFLNDYKKFEDVICRFLEVK